MGDPGPYPIVSAPPADEPARTSRYIVGAWGPKKASLTLLL